jgi:hypothetical protein
MSRNTVGRGMELSKSYPVCGIYVQVILVLNIVLDIVGLVALRAKSAENDIPKPTNIAAAGD